MFIRFRRSADVRSVGYSELLCLSQKDLMEVRFFIDFSCDKVPSRIIVRNTVYRTKELPPRFSIVYCLDTCKVIADEQTNLHCTPLPSTLLIFFFNFINGFLINVKF